MYTKAELVDENGEKKEILTFGPVSILPEYQRMGYGKILMEHSFERASELGYDVIVIFGNPGNYVARGFKSCKNYNVGISKDVFPVPLLVKELKINALQGENWIYKESDVFNIKEEDAAEFDKDFEQFKKEYRSSQELFYIYSNSFIKATEH